MKLKYYLRGLAVGILVTTIILAISFSQTKRELSDQEVINRAKQLGMVMADSGKIEDYREDTQTETGQSEQGETEENVTGDTQNGAEDNEGVTGDNGTVTGDNGTVTGDNGTVPGDIGTVAGDNEGGIGDNEGGTADNGTGTEDAGSDTEGKMVTFVISKGQFGRQISESLKKEGLVDDAEAFMKYLGETGKSEEILPGTYEIPMGSTYEEIVKILLAPKPLG
ncbi:MAG: hypothetical protein SOZ17_09380 [Agathobacter sp.]|nr:hypothetical protein [Agathobacter sp.]